MLVVVAGRHDATAKTFVERHAAAGVALLSSDDLSRPGWRFSLASGGPGPDGAAVVGGHQVATADVAGVLTRLPRVTEAELPGIVPEDRTYVAAEMTAFLLAWLSSLRCPVLNRPTTTCLAGPYWWPAQWVRVAHALGVPVRPVHYRADPGRLSSNGEASPSLRCRHGDASRDEANERRAPPIGPSASVPPGAADASVLTVTVVGNRCLGTDDERLQTVARRLAHAAGAGLLAVSFETDGPGPRFVAASPWPDISLPDVGDAILTHLTGATR